MSVFGSLWSLKENGYNILKKIIVVSIFSANTISNKLHIDSFGGHLRNYTFLTGAFWCFRSSLSVFPTPQSAPG